MGMTNKVPDSYPTFFRTYYVYVRNLLRYKIYYGVSLEDATQEFFFQFYERGYLTAYDPAKGPFNGWVAYLVEMHSRNVSARNYTHSVRRGVDRHRELYLDTPVTEDGKALVDLLGFGVYEDSDPADIIVRREEIAEAKAQVNYLRSQLDQFPATRYDRYPANQTPEDKRKTLGDVMDAIRWDIEHERPPSPGHTQAGRTDEVWAAYLGVNRKTAKTWSIKMKEQANVLVHGL